ncbi:MAG: peptide chain release factor N(5)-glutamine methyltransferase [Candidatus Nomurabacteria bacterium]|jgi:release factor glutamine methyltransferase|nr:peptide chain release factor N(5)-glutamine methyltransferase [Candidatus Nomurabacteria bacterium]
MNVSLKPKKPPTVKEWLKSAASELKVADVPSPRLDAELILAHAISHERTWLVAHDSYELTATGLQQANSLAQRRIQHEPLAYLTGYREFYGRKFIVTPDVLIPRPETEQLAKTVGEIFQSCFEKTPRSMTIDAAKQRCLICDDRLNSCCASKSNSGKSTPTIIDIGTGSGAIAITLALELPNAQVFASDISKTAIQVAKRNAKQLGAVVEFAQSDLLHKLGSKKFDIIVANLPYVAREWPVSPAANYEPKLALYADDAGQSLLKKLVSAAPKSLKPGGILALELDPRQVEDIAAYAVKSQHFTLLQKAPFFVILQIK